MDRVYRGEGWRLGRGWGEKNNGSGATGVGWKASQLNDHLWRGVVLQCLGEVPRHRVDALANPVAVGARSLLSYKSKADARFRGVAEETGAFPLSVLVAGLVVLLLFRNACFVNVRSRALTDFGHLK